MDAPSQPRRTRKRGLELEVLIPLVSRLVGEAGPEGLTKREIVDHVVARFGVTSMVSVQRALTELVRRSSLEWDLARKRWVLHEPHPMPVEDPVSADLVMLVIAQGLVESLGDTDLALRARALADAILVRTKDRERAREQALAGAAGEAGTKARPRPRARAAKLGVNVPAAARDEPLELPAGRSVSCAITLGTTLSGDILQTVVLACRRAVLRIRYHSPWKEPIAESPWVEVEPWAVRIHDGAAYVRVWRRDVRQARTLRVAEIDACERVPAAEAGALVRVPDLAEIWGDGDPAFGIDRDRPGRAVIVLEGPVARWASRVVWSPTQVDAWIDEHQTLERRLRYRSCRELARRIASVYDAVIRIEPAALAAEVAKLVQGNPRRVDGSRHVGSESAQRSTTIDREDARAPRRDELVAGPLARVAATSGRVASTKRNARGR